MDVVTPPFADIDPKLELQSDVERARGEREDLERQIASDREKLGGISSAMDAMVTRVWRDVFSQLQSMRDKENLTAALTFGWTEGYQWVSAAGMLAAAGGLIALLQVMGGVIAVGMYLVLALVGFFVAREHSLTPARKARASYLGDDGKDVRFVAFTRYEPSLQHPLIGFDGPRGGMLEDRAWKIPGVREKDALEETFVEVLDDRRSNVLLTRFPDKKPTLVHADLENPFVRSYGVFLQRALERHLPEVQTQADDYRALVSHYGQRKELDERLGRLEEELREFDGTAAIMRALPLSAALRNRLLRQVVLFRLGEPSARRGMFVVSGDRVDALEVMQTLARASAATLLRLSFTQIKIGYVGQGASTVARLFDTARRARSILFIDEAERFFSSGGSAAYESMRREVVSAILKEWENVADRSDVWVVAVAKERDGLDDGIVARFGTLIDLTPGGGDASGHSTVIIDASGEEVDEHVALPEPVQARSRLLSAMFAHVDMMESQGISVPRGVLISGGSTSAKRSFVRSLGEQSGLPLITTLVDEIDTALLTARDRGRALLAVDVPEYADPGAVAHLAVLIDELAANKATVFVLAMGPREDAIDPELRARFSEFIDLAELDGDARRTKLREMLEGRETDFDLEAALEPLEAQSEGMTEEQLRHMVDDAVRKAALRAIDAGSPTQIVIALADFEPLAAVAAATKDDEAGL